MSVAQERLRAICLALPEACEELMRRGPSYRVAEKIFALERPWKAGPGLWCKVPEGMQPLMVRDDPAMNKRVADMSEPGPVGQPDDIGPMIASLLSEDNRWVNGQCIEASGGMALY